MLVFVNSRCRSFPVGPRKSKDLPPPACALCISRYPLAGPVASSIIRRKLGSSCFPFMLRFGDYSTGGKEESRDKLCQHLTSVSAPILPSHPLGPWAPTRHSPERTEAALKGFKTHVGQALLMANDK